MSTCPGSRLNNYYDKTSPPPGSDIVSITTKKGIVNGFYVTSSTSSSSSLAGSADDGSNKSTIRYASFMGVPFANPTKPLQDPEPKNKWDQPLNCFAYGDACPQKESTGFGGLIKTEIPDGDDIGSSSDDCLNLNILTPSDALCAIKKGNRHGLSLPVMVWIHGGSNVMCSNKGDFGGFSNTASSAFVQHGVVCVSINYRHGCHGFVHIPEAGISNLALKDVICGLEWIQSEIAAFGGNPNNVTISGQSAGGIAVAILLGCPRASGLFHRAIVQSGGLSIWSQETYTKYVLDDYKQVLQPLLKANGRKTGDFSTAALQSLTSTQLTTATHMLENLKPMIKKHGSFYSPPVFNSIVDDELFHGRDPIDNVILGCSKNVDLMLGATHNEASLLYAMLPRIPFVHSILSFIFGKALTGMVIPMAIRGALGVTKSDDSKMANGALKNATTVLVDGFADVAKKRHFEGEGKTIVPLSIDSFGTGEDNGVLATTAYLFGCGGYACSRLAQAQSKFGNVFIYELKLTDEESPKLRNGHMVDLPLIFTMDDEKEKIWMNQAMFGRDERGVGLDHLAASIRQCFAEFVKIGIPKSFCGHAWPTYPCGMVFASPRKSEGSFKSNGPFVQKVCKYSADSLETKLWDKAMATLNTKPTGGRGSGYTNIKIITVGVAALAAGVYWFWNRMVEY